ncbi:hypothetical protein PG995_008837 [Apiospora arundinis]|uniref:Thioredoxin-like protein n=1 Tax=Apiospora arundinis TaxID=335852 RepID=A0ABR2JMI7_9PEZI
MGEDKTVHIGSMTELTALFKSTTYVVIDFYADWCAPCKTIAPAYQELANMYSVPGILAFAKVRTDADQGTQMISAVYSIRAMPTMLFYKDGRQVAVNGSPYIQGANLPVLKAAAEKLGALAKKRQAEAAAAA